MGVWTSEATPDTIRWIAADDFNLPEIGDKICKIIKNLKPES